MSIRYSMVKTDSAVTKMARQILDKCNELKHIDLDEIQFAWRKSPKSRYYGHTRSIRGEHCMFTDKKAVIVLWLKGWKQHDKAWRMLLIYHELRHIYDKNKNGQYRLVRHNLEDFDDIVKQYGTRWEGAKKFLRRIEHEKS